MIKLGILMQALHYFVFKLFKPVNAWAFTVLKSGFETHLVLEVEQLLVPRRFLVLYVFGFEILQHVVVLHLFYFLQVRLPYFLDVVLQRRAQVIAVVTARIVSAWFSQNFVFARSRNFVFGNLQWLLLGGVSEFTVISAMNGLVA